MRPLPPYAALLGISVEPGEDVPVMMMRPGAHVLGRPGFLHGGAIAGLLEIAAFGALHAALGEDRPKIKPITVTVDYLRGGRLVETRAVGRILRLGNRIANVEARAWQEDRDRPIATARMNLFLDRGQ